MEKNYKAKAKRVGSTEAIEVTIKATTKGEFMTMVVDGQIKSSRIVLTPTTIQDKVLNLNAIFVDDIAQEIEEGYIELI